MNNDAINNRLKLSYYKEIAMLNEEHGITLVQHIQTSKVYVKKEVSPLCRDVYEKLKETPVDGTPRVYEVVPQDGMLVIIEEQIIGKTLQEVLDENGPLGDNIVSDYAVQLCDILKILHSFTPPIIHRDIKPSNIILRNDGKVCLIDFNAAKKADPSKSRDTMLIGTQGFAAPEQFGFGSSNIQTDIYAMGNLILDLLTGDTNPAKLGGTWLKKVILKCLNMYPKNRYQSAEKLKKAIKRSRPSFKIMIVAIIVGLLIVGWIIPDDYVSAENHNFTIQGQDYSSYFESVQASAESRADEVVDSIYHPNTYDNTTSSVNDGLNVSSPVGTYAGNGGEKLVIAEDGLAYYYCSDKTYSEVQCPWKIKDDVLTIQLSKLHCEIYEDVKSNDFSSIRLKSNSRNWDDETFEKISADAEGYIISPPPSASSYVGVMDDGTLTFDIGSFSVYVPKQFRDIGTLTNSSPEQFILVDADVDTSFVGSVVVKANMRSDPEFPKMDQVQGKSKYFASSYMNNINAGNPRQIIIAGENAFETEIAGDLNADFSGLAGRTCSAKVIILNDSESRDSIYMLFLQTVGTGMDDTDAFQYILENMTKKL